MVMFPPQLGKSTIGVRNYRRSTKRRKRRNLLGATARRHALRVSPVRLHSRSTPSISSIDALDTNTNEKNGSAHSMLTRSEARARLFGMKRRIVDRLLQKKASETGNKERQDGRLLILAFRDMDKDGDGTIDYQEFHEALGPEGLNCGLGPSEISDLFIALDTDGSGDVSMGEFLHELMIADKPPEELMIDRGRRKTLDWMERKVYKFKKEQKEQQERQDHQQHQELKNILTNPSLNEDISHQLQSSYSFRRSGTASGRLQDEEGHITRDRRMKLKRENQWEHPLKSTRPSTSNSEYGSYHNFTSRRNNREVISYSPFVGSGSGSTGSSRSRRVENDSISASLSISKSARNKTDKFLAEQRNMNAKTANHSLPQVSPVQQQKVKRLNTPAFKYLSQRKFGGKCYESSPKFIENRKTWNNIGYGLQGIIPETDLYHPEPLRRSSLSIAPMYPRPDVRGGSIQSNIANKFRREMKGRLHSSTNQKDKRTLYEANHGFVPLSTKKMLKDRGEKRVEFNVQNRSNKSLSQQRNCVMGKCRQQLTYYQKQMESQGYLDRQRGIGTGKGGLVSEQTRKHRGGFQVAGCVRGIDTPWLGV